MRILIATDAWHPQVNGVVRTLTSLARAASSLGAEITFLTPEGFGSFGVPTYPGLRLAITNRREIARRIERARPDAIHIATEGTIGWAVRRYCLNNKLAFTTSYTTRFPEYVSVRTGIPDAVGYWVMRRFPDAHFLGEKTGKDLTAHMAAADVFVFPSLTDTFGVVQLESLACGTPVAAFPVTGPLDVIANNLIGAIDNDLRAACLRALTMSRETCRAFALERSWENSARQFIGNLAVLQPSRANRPAPVLASRSPVRG